MGAFDGVSFRWGDATVSIPADRLIGALARLEEHVLLGELAGLDGSHHAKLAEGLAAVLRFAGVETDGDAVYLAMLPDPQARQDAYAAVEALIESTAPPTRRGGRSGRAAAAPNAGLVEGMFKALVGTGGLAPRDFWSLTPREAWWLIDARQASRMATPKMTEDEANEVYRQTYGSEEDDS